MLVLAVFTLVARAPALCFFPYGIESCYGLCCVASWLLLHDYGYPSRRTRDFYLAFVVLSPACIGCHVIPFRLVQYPCFLPLILLASEGHGLIADNEP